MKKYLFTGIAVAAIVVILLYATGVLNGQQAEQANVDKQPNQAAAASVVPTQTDTTNTPAPSTSTTSPASTASSPDSASPSTGIPSSVAGAVPTESAPSPSPSTTPKVSAGASAASSNRILKLTTPNMQGDDVKLLQEKLGLTADGIFGQSTQTAVIAFQKANGLTADGIVGPGTLSKLGL